jgi:hypothetical protein
MESKTVQAWRPFIQPILMSKLNEFKLFGYNEVTEEEIWQCLEGKVWKGNPTKRLFEVTQDILGLSPNTYMNFIQLGALGAKKDDLLASIRALTEDEEC